MATNKKFRVKHGLEVNTLSGSTSTLVFPTSDGTAGQVIQTDGSGNLTFADSAGTFVALTDTPSSFTGQGGRVVQVNTAENGIEFGAAVVGQSSRDINTGDGTTTATVLAHAMLTTALKENKSTRDIKNGVESAINKISKYLDSRAIPVKGDMLKQVAAISCNNDTELGNIIAEAYEKVGEDGIVLMEDSEDEKTYADVTEGIKLDCKLTSPH